jgi:hypothetical protein
MNAYNPSKQAHPAGTQFVRDRLQWSIALARSLGLTTTELEALDRDLNKLEFKDMNARLQPILQTYRNAASSKYGGNSPSVFELGIQLTFASAMIRNAQTDRPETAARWRQLAANFGPQMASNITTNKLEATLPLANDFTNRTTGGESFFSLERFTEEMFRRWQQDFLAAPAWSAGPGPVAGVVVFSTGGQLTKSDPFDTVRKNHHAKVHLVQLQSGVKYQIDLESGDGKAGPHNPGYFDVWLRLEDAGGKILADNDDGGDGFNARISFTAPHSGSYRLIATSFATGATGNYTLKVTQK